MRIRTMIVLVVTILLTIVLMQNIEPVKFTVLFTYMYVPKLVMMTAFSAVGFILGVLVARPRKIKLDRDLYHETDEPKRKTGTLSDEDRDYLS